MLFNSSQFVVFFFITIFLSAFTKGRTEKLILLAASFYFYMAWNAWFVLLLLASLFIDYFSALAIEKYRQDKRLKNLFLTISMVGNLSFLGYFKYTNFLLGAANDLVGAGFPSYDIVLPVGISFYTFQSMSYTIDVYREQLKAKSNVLDFALYVAFFPQLVAGPIVRAQTFFRDLDQRLPVFKTDIQIAFLRILIGFTRKLVFADNLGVVVDQTFSNYSTLGALDIWIGAMAFGWQIYFDFAGYTDIAIGVARLFGFQFDPNFSFPMAVKNITEHWNKWHISFSTWIRDYIYIPLGGSRGGKLFVIRNMLITWLFGGIWHGAAYHYVVWGLWQAVMIIVHREYSATGLARLLNDKGGRIYDLSARVLTMFSLGFGFVMFRAQNMTDAWDMIQGMLLVDRGLLAGKKLANGNYLLVLVICYAAAYMFADNRVEKIVHSEKRMIYMALACFYLILVFGVTESKNFLYFAF